MRPRVSPVFFFQAEDGIRDWSVTGVQTCALPIWVIGPAQSAKTSLLRCINRTIDFTESAKVSGTIRIDGEDVQKVKNVYELRRKIGKIGRASCRERV